MEITDIPLHKWMGIAKADHPFVFKVAENPNLLNHVGTYHACIQLALAEASAGQFMKDQFPEYANTLVPVVRKTEAKYAKAANGTLYAHVTFESQTQEEILNLIQTKSRFPVQTKVEIVNEAKEITLQVNFHWFLVKIG